MKSKMAEKTRVSVFRRIFNRGHSEGCFATDVVCRKSSRTCNKMKSELDTVQDDPVA